MDHIAAPNGDGNAADRPHPREFADTWLIVPCFNEATVIRGVLENALETFPNIVAVNDGSRDESAAEIHAAGAHLVNHPVNLGQGAAIQTGIEYAMAQAVSEYFVTFDADGQHQVKDVAAMVRAMDGAGQSSSARASAISSPRMTRCR